MTEPGANGIGFRCLNEQWGARLLGPKRGVGSGPYLPEYTELSAEFRWLSNPNIGPYYGSLHFPPDKASENDLCASLQEAIAQSQRTALTWTPEWIK